MTTKDAPEAGRETTAPFPPAFTLVSPVEGARVDVSNGPAPIDPFETPVVASGTIELQF